MTMLVIVGATRASLGALCLVSAPHCRRSVSSALDRSGSSISPMRRRSIALSIRCARASSSTQPLTPLWIWRSRTRRRRTPSMAMQSARLARACATRGVRLIHVSTDFVFDGTARAAVSAGRCRRIRSASMAQRSSPASSRFGRRPGLDWRIVRTAWVYARQRAATSCSTMLRLMQRAPGRASRGRPDRHADERRLAERMRAGAPRRSRQVARASSISPMRASRSWYDFAVAIQEEARGARPGSIAPMRHPVPIGTDQYPTPARRPSYSVLDVSAPTLDRARAARRCTGAQRFGTY